MAEGGEGEVFEAIGRRSPHVDPEGSWISVDFGVDCDGGGRKPPYRLQCRLAQATYRAMWVVPLPYLGSETLRALSRITSPGITREQKVLEIRCDCSELDGIAEALRGGFAQG